MSEPLIPLSPVLFVALLAAIWFINEGHGPCEVCGKRIYLWQKKSTGCQFPTSEYGRERWFWTHPECLNRDGED